MKLPHVLCRALKLVSLQDMSKNERLLLIAAYLAARVAPSMDSSVWSSKSGKRRRRGLTSDLQVMVSNKFSSVTVCPACMFC